MEGHAGDNIKTQNARWNFGGSVPENFESHAQRSIPLYERGHDLIAKVSDFFLKENSTCYDFGCSTGTLIQKLHERHSGKKIQFIGIDQEEKMIAKAKKSSKESSVSFINDDLLNVELDKSDLIICYYTIQFTSPQNRQLIFNRIYESLNWGGALLLFEKVRAPDARFQDLTTSLYTDFKIDNGYSADEIINKTQSLKGILEPFSTNANMDMMKRAGFEDIMSIMKYVCFEGFLAIK